MCGFEWFMYWVHTFTNPNLKVIVVPDYQSRSFAPCVGIDKYYGKVKATAGAIVTPAEGPDYSLDNPDFSYSSVEVHNAKYPNLIYIDSYPAYDRMRANNPEEFRRMSNCCEASTLQYKHNNDWVLHVITSETSLIAPAETQDPLMEPLAMNR
mmetsp:Transcript_19933/g.24163  ORF Transcript_19933/g.24163 Transcript_19933/m.24163 type:complete len:153 (+) Transcript_19933:229-687(+)